ncbi:MMPL family transporter [Chitinophaga oryziterrae]|uniref:MMPL family transporter n=1 Tax=Chitinophaga oryziterrae TaxID=1031224 RepID=A0A6N8JHW4_9BACT|nr:efflux RND transporter permease subunit [Chitinophaga oryziterrae]MVT44853.1 MMPL family transporter [Chitinophaga oryziterrae]
MQLIIAAMKHWQVTITIVLLLVLSGIYSLLTMPRAEDPTITIRQGLVIALYPGADEKQMETQVTDQLEKYLFSFEQVRKAKTVATTTTGQVMVMVELQEWVQDTRQFWNTLQQGLNNALRPQLPSGVIGPIVNTDFGNVVTHMITISSPDRSYAELEQYADKLEDGIKILPAVAQIKRYGGQREQIYVTIPDEKLYRYKFDLTRIAQVLQAQNHTGNSGNIMLPALNVPLYTGGQYKDIPAIRDQVIDIGPDGQIVRLKDIARIERRYEEPVSFIQSQDNKVVMLAITIQPGNNVVQFGHTLDRKLQEIKKQLPSDVAVNTIVNQSQFVASTIRHFMSEFTIAIIAVMGVVMIMLPLRIAIIPALVAPISIFISIGILDMMGIALHQVTLAALIICLGMVVDDAMVVVDSYLDKLDSGTDRWTAAWLSASQLMLPVVVATAAIILAFLPLQYCLGGLAREFMAPLPVSVAIALITSLTVALLLTPLMCYTFIRQGLKKTDDHIPAGKTLLTRTQAAFNKGVTICFRYPRLTITMGALSVVSAVLMGIHVDQELFPTFERTQFNLEIWLPPNTPLQTTAEAVKQVEQELQGDKRIVNTCSFIGTSAPRFQVTYAPQFPRENYAQIFINTVSEAATKEMAEEYLHKFDHFIPGGYVHVRQLSFNQTVAPVEVRITGPDIDILQKIAGRITPILENTAGTNWVRTDYETNYVAATLSPKTEEAARLGVSNAAITQTLQAGLKGWSVSTLWEGDKPVDILLRLEENNRKDFNKLQNVHVTSQSGNKVLLREVATLAPAWHTTNIIHRNGLRTLTVMAEAQKGIKAAKIIAAIHSQIDQLQLPVGYQITYGGEEEAVAENLPPMIKALTISMLCIFLLLLFRFKSFVKVLIVLSTFPLSLPGAMLGLLITGNPIGFTGFMGIISLIGIVVRNGIIKVDYADELVREQGYSPQDAAMAAASRRMRPIFLTSLATAVGVIPMILGKSPLWSPLASVVAVGSLVSMLMTLFVVPVLYARYVKPEKSISPDTVPPLHRSYFKWLPSVNSKMMLFLVVPLSVFFPAIAHSQSVITLETCKQQALLQNRQLTMLQEEVYVAQATKQQAGAAAKPKITMGINSFYVGTPLNRILPEYGIYSNAGINQPIFVGGKIKLSSQVAQKTLEITLEQKEAGTAEVLYATEKAYWQVVAAQEKIKLAQQSKQQVTALYNDLVNAYQAGMIYKNDLLRAGVQLNECDLRLTQAGNNLILTCLSLAQITGLDNSVDFSVADTVNDTFTPVIPEDILQTINGNAACKIAEKKVGIAVLEEKLAKADFSPAINANISGIYFAGKNSGNMGVIPQPSFLSGYGVINIQIPIFSGGLKRQQMISQQHKTRILQLQSSETKELLAIELQQTYIGLNEAAKRVKLASASLIQAGENLRLCNDRFKAGTVTGKDVLDAELLWQQTHTALIDAQIAYRMREALLKKITSH